ncbi:E3 ubiquitin ligase PQT3-like [Cardamine amara subsp. amara]|uniref:E3 ubiquitin ligase PQT3-like n=1 Tax=Cardamine amara subsp. amara TaxID=228776 RepID=A0ABD1B4W2_CARAN
MAIYYKFKSARDYDTIAMDGPFISVGILKDKIFETKHLGSGKDLDIVVSNAQTNEEYLDEAMLIPKNTSVLIRRVPGRPRITVITAQEPRIENKMESVQADVTNIPVADPSAAKYPEDEYDEFGTDLYSIPDAQDAQHNNPCPDMAPADEKIDEESKIQALIDTPALDWQRQGPDTFGGGRGYGRGMNGRMGGRGYGMERKTPPPGYVCHRCNVPGHFIQHCPTNGDPSYDVKRVKPPTGIPKSMLMATPDGSYSLPSGAVAVLKPNEDAFEKEMEGLPSTTRSVGELPPELKCPLCKEVMRDAALTSKCCYQSYCDQCIRDHIISKSRCVCGATDVLADDLLPNKTLRDTINRILEAGNDSTENAGSVGHIPDLESARCPPPKVPSPTTSVASKGDKKSVVSNNNDASTLKPPMETAEIISPPQPSGEVNVDKPLDACESTQGSVTVKESTISKLNLQANKEDMPQPVAAGEPGKKKKKKPRVPGNDMQWNPVPDLAGPDYMMQMGPGPQYFNGMQPGFNGVQPGFNGVQPGFNGFHPGFNGFGGPFPGAMPPFMGYGLNPMDMGFGGGMNMMHPDPFIAQGFGFPNIPPPHRDLAEMGNRMNLQRAMMGRDEAEARKTEMLRKRENERRIEGGKMFRDGENSRMMMNNGTSASASSINPNKSRQAPPPSNLDYDRRRRPERLSPEHPPPRQINSPSRDSKRKSERYSDERDRPRDRERSRHQDLEREHERTRDRRDEDRSRDHRNHRDSERNQHHHRKRSEPLSSEPPAVTKSDIDNNNKSSVFARISFPEEESSSKRRKVSSSSSTSVTDPPGSAAAATVGTSVHRHSRKEMEVADYESSDEDRHFKRKPSRYERSPPVVVNDVSEDKLRYSKRGKGERSRA